MSAKPQNAPPWPTPQDYNEALQNPRLSFHDSELQSGIPDVTPLGLPRPITGGFASVYSVRSGAKRWAVRCFLREFADHHERYAEIGRHLAAAQIPYTVGFQFLQQGIRVRGHWYPILKMEWIEGSTFQQMIEANVQNPIALADFADRWIKMLGVLRKHGIAHGDLQHGNVLIAGGDFRLIDYDGMFVPAFKGKSSHEVGHRNYQHPARTENDFGPHLDNFSGWAIYLTLIALSIDASLWGRFGAGEEHLLFRKDDFDEPRYSRLFRVLNHLKDDRIQRYLPLFRSYLGMKLSSISSPADVIGGPVIKREPQRERMPSWSRNNQQELFTPTKTIPDEPVHKVDLPVEVVQEVNEDRIEAIPFVPAVKPERVLLSSYAVFMVILIGVVTRGGLPGIDGILLLMTGLGCVVLCLSFSYATLEQVRSKTVLWFFLELRRTRCDAAGYGVARMSDWIPRLELKESQKLRHLGAKDIDYEREERDRIAEVKRTLAAWIDELNVRRKHLTQAEAAEEVQILHELKARHEQLLKEGEFLSTAPAHDLTKRDRKKLLKWRKFMDELAQAGPPKVLPADERLRIRRRYDLERRSVRRSETFARAAAGKKILKIRRTCKRRHERLDIKRAVVQRRFERRKQLLLRTITRSTNWLDGERLALGGLVREMDRYRDVRFPKYLLHVLGVS